MENKILLVRERALRCVEVERTFSLLVPEHSARDPDLLKKLVEQSSIVVPFAPIEGTEVMEPMFIHVVGEGADFSEDSEDWP